MQDNDTQLQNNARGGKRESCHPDKESETRHHGGFPNLIQKWAKNLVNPVMAETLEFKPLELYDADGNMEVSWYFNFYFRNPSTQAMERLKPTFNINRIPDKMTRYVYAKKVIKLVNERLSKGEINPFTQPMSAIGNTTALPAALERAHKEHCKQKSPETKKSYKTHLNRFVDFLELHQLHKKTPDKFLFDQAQDFQFYLQEDKDLINSTINNNIGLIRQHFDYLRKKRFIIVNPFLDITSLPERRSFKYVPYNEEEKVMISDCLKKQSPLLYLFTQIIYSCFCRPKEICALTRSDIDFKKGYIVVRHSTIKNNRTSYRQIFTPLLNLMLELGIDRLPMKSIIFEEICGDNPRYELRRKKVTSLWTELIQEGLKIQNTMYTLKHTGNCDYILMNPQYDILWLQQQNGHATLEQTQTYIRDLPIRRLQESNVKVQLFGQA